MSAVRQRIGVLVLGATAVLGVADLVLATAVRDRVPAGSAGNALVRQFSDGSVQFSVLGVTSAVLLIGLFTALAVGVARGDRWAGRTAWWASVALLVTFVLGGALAEPAEAVRPLPNWFVQYNGFSSALAVLLLAAGVVVLFPRRPRQSPAVKPVWH